jgi:hypothetical protein
MTELCDEDADKDGCNWNCRSEPQLTVNTLCISQNYIRENKENKMLSSQLEAVFFLSLRDTADLES